MACHGTPVQDLDRGGDREIDEEVNAVGEEDRNGDSSPRGDAKINELSPGGDNGDNSDGGVVGDTSGEDNCDVIQKDDSDGDRDRLRDVVDRDRGDADRHRDALVSDRERDRRPGCVADRGSGGRDVQFGAEDCGTTRGDGMESNNLRKIASSFF